MKSSRIAVLGAGAVIALLTIMQFPATATSNPAQNANRCAEAGGTFSIEGSGNNRVNYCVVEDTTFTFGLTTKQEGNNEGWSIDLEETVELEYTEGPGCNPHDCVDDPDPVVTDSEVINCHLPNGKTKKNLSGDWCQAPQ